MSKIRKPSPEFINRFKGKMSTIKMDKELHDKFYSHQRTGSNQNNTKENEGMHCMFKENFRYLNEIGKYSQSSVRSNKISTQISPLPSPLSDSKLNLVSESSQITNASREPFSVKVSEVQFKNNLITPSIKKPTINGQKIGELKVDEILPIQNKKRSFAASENIPSLTEIQKRKVDELNNNALIRKKYKYLYA